MRRIAEPSQLDCEKTAGSVLSPLARLYIARSLRPNTRRAYAVQLSQWLKWRGLDDLEPADPIDFANFLAERAAAGQSISTLRSLVAAMKAGHAAKGWPFNSTAPQISRVLRGIANADRRLPRQAEPLPGSLLSDMLRSMAAGQPSIIDRRDAALLANGDIFALRRSELVGLDLEDQAQGADMGSGVLRRRPKTLEVVIAHSKTSAGMPEVVAVPRQNNSEAVRAIEAWIACAGLKARQPVLWSFWKGGALKRRLSDQCVSSIVKARVAEHARLVDDPSVTQAPSAELGRYSGHSLRVGFVVTAAECGADLRAIATITRHRSLAMPARYAQRADLLRTSPHQLAGVGLDAERS